MHLEACKCSNLTSHGIAVFPIIAEANCMEWGEVSPTIISHLLIKKDREFYRIMPMMDRLWHYVVSLISYIG